MELFHVEHNGYSETRLARHASFMRLQSGRNEAERTAHCPCVDAY